jgi:peptidyl-prolyl cis-trans isomerase B (cyclophilin B)
MQRSTVVYAIILLGMAVALAGCQPKSAATGPAGPASQPTAQTPPPTPPEPVAEEKQPPKGEGEKPKAEGEKPKEQSDKVTIETTKGNIEVKLYPKEAPKTVERFLTLAKEGYYDDMVWHRVVPGFVVQTGQGPDRPPIPDEVNEHKHQAGSLAMAKPGPRDPNSTRLSEPDSATTEFYIAMDRAPHLDTEFAVFGQVEKGMDVVKKITQEDKIKRIVIANEPKQKQP